MVDLTKQEQAAIRAAMRPAAEVLEQIGWEARLHEVTEPQILALIEAVIGGFRDAMQASACHDGRREVPF